MEKLLIMGGDWGKIGSAFTPLGVGKGGEESVLFMVLFLYKGWGIVRSGWN